MRKTVQIQMLIGAIVGLTLSSQVALAQCTTLSGFAAFKRCALEADSAADRENLQRRYEQMLADEMARARAGRTDDSLRALGLSEPLARRSASEFQRNRLSQTPFEHRNIESEMQHQNTMRQMRNSDAARARNQFRLDQGRVRSQDLLYGTSNRQRFR